MSRQNIIFRISCALLGLSSLTSCGLKSVEMGPVETVEAFYAAVTTGNWCEAEALCDTLSMQDYFETNKHAWDQMTKEDEKAMTIARSVLEQTNLTIVDMHKDGDRRIVLYTLEVNGHSKQQKATLRKEGGAWRVERISEEN